MLRHVRDGAVEGTATREKRQAFPRSAETGVWSPVELDATACTR
jgi:hypothetical protein